ncbi:SDR family NAD(P)-dependent oxidoreductase [Paracidovorax valerianellae]|uniref:SDR family NAD(P)-dependent oxidoreductase n=1 Tax=Paracidovorax valerianellae TaxID=187868 RepID=UPI000AD69EE6|nr:SDR family oxidoreductase [Paracidovorax valerianellae]MDA8447211.1 SDR family oxidoreductase [Paracidovorax valerianellae]
MINEPTAHFSLHGRRVLVTGASSGIGAAVAKLCSELGAELCLSGRDSERLEITHAGLAGSGHTVVAGDITDPATLDALVQSAPHFDGLVSCAGVATLVPMRMASEKYLQQMLAVNYLAPIGLAQRLLHKRKLREGASLVFISALSARAAPQAAGAYAASKAALEAASRTLGLEHAKQRIRSNCIAPGYVDTPMLQRLGSAADMSEKIALTPLGTVTPDDVAPAAAWLLSPASRWITRTTLTLDGGISLPIRL